MQCLLRPHPSGGHMHVPARAVHALGRAAFGWNAFSGTFGTGLSGATDPRSLQSIDGGCAAFEIAA